MNRMSADYEEKIYEALRNNPVYDSEDTEREETVERLIKLGTGELCPVFDDHIWNPKALYFNGNELFMSSMASSIVDIDTAGHTLEHAVKEYNELIDARLFDGDTSIDEDHKVVAIINVSDL